MKPHRPIHIASTIGQPSEDEIKMIFRLMKEGKRKELLDNSYVHSVSA